MKTMNQLNRRSFIRGSTGAFAALVMTSSPIHNAAAASHAEIEELRKLMTEMEAQGSKMLSVPRKDGQFLNLLVKASRSKNILEVGTSQGYSAIWISRALEETGGKMTTIDIAPEKVTLAKSNLAKAGLAHRVTFLEGDAHKIVATLDSKFDFVFLDADKEGEMDYFNKVYPGKLVPGGIIAVHNAIRMASSMKNYLDLVQSHPDFDSVILSLTMEDGFSISYRHRA